MNNYTEQQIDFLGKGALHVEDNRDYIFGATAPEPFDWNKGYVNPCPFIASMQGTSLSCVGQSTMNLAKNAWFHKNGNLQDFSARFPYCQIALPNGGAFLRDGVDLLVKQGDCLNVTMPSGQTEAIMRDKTGLPEAQIVSKEYDIYGDLAYASVGLNIDTLAVAIRDSGAVMIGATGHNIGWSTPDLKPPTLGDGQPTWGHAVTAVGAVMRNGKKAIKILNSWSSAWGENGYGYMYEDYMKWLQAAFILTDNFINPNMFDLLKTNTRPEQYVIINGKRFWVLNERVLVDLQGVLKPIKTVSEAELLTYPDAGVLGGK